MALGRGERIGDAYVRIYGDGSSLPGDVEDALDKVDVNKYGERAGRDYGRKFREQFEEDLPKISELLEQDVIKGARNFTKIRETLDTKLFKQLTKDIRKQGFGKEIARGIVADLEKEFASGVNPDMFKLRDILDEEGEKTGEQRIDANIADLPRRAARVAKQITDNEKREAAERLRTQQQLFDEFTKAGRDAAKAAIEYERDHTRALKVEEQLRVADLRAQVEEERRVFAERQKQFRREAKERIDLERDWTHALQFESDRRQKEREAERSDLRRLIESIDGVGDSVSVAFGKGSRNNFINFTGSLIGNSVKMLTVLPRLAEGFLVAKSAIGEVFGNVKEAQGFGAKLSALFAGTAEGTGAFAASLTAAGVGAAALLLVLPLLASTLSLVLGVVVALAGSISFALIGSLAALSALVLPLAGGIAVLAAGILGMDDATKRLMKESIKPLVAEFKSLGAVASKELFKDAPAQIKALSTGLDGLEPITRKTASALSDVADGFIDGLNSKNFDAFIKVMETFIPRALRTLGRVATQTFGGIGALFRVIAAPGGIAEEFLGFLDRVSGEFNDLNNKAGQSKLGAFFDRASTSAKSLFELIDNVGELIGAAFSAGQEGGDTIIDHLAEKVQELTDYINANPDAVENYFKDAVEFADAVGSAVEELIGFIGALDTAASRETVIELFETLDDVMAGVNTTAGLLSDTFMLLKGVFEIVFSPIGTLIALFRDGIPGAIAYVINSFADFVDGLSIVGSAIDLLPGVDGVADGIDGLADTMRDFADGLTNPKAELNGVNLELDHLLGKSGSSVDIIIGPGLNGAKTLIGGVDVSLATLLDKNGDPIDIRPGPGFNTTKTRAEEGRTAIGDLFDYNGKQVNVFAGGGFGEIVNAADRAIKKIQTLLAIKAAAEVGGGKVATGGVIDALGLHRIRKMAAGGFANSMQSYTIGEAGREAIVPLDRPLGAVDPAVRALSAYAQGLVPAGEMRGVGVDASGWTIVSNSEDPRTVAQEVLNNLVGASL